MNARMAPYPLKGGFGHRWMLPGWTALLASAALAAPPIQPLPAPNYSFDLASPTVIAGPIHAADVLRLGPSGPEVLIPGERLGLYSPYDELDGLSGSNADVPPTASLALLFSVDRDTVGVAPPDPLLVAMGVPYTVLDQAAHGQAAGDQFMSMQIFSHFRGVLERGGRTSGAVLTRNNYDEGGTDFGAQPATSASQDAGGAPEDEVNGMSTLPPASLRDAVIKVYFTASAQSPSLATLPGASQPSGANIYYNPDPLNFAPTALYATFAQLGLGQFDDIDALIVFDTNANGIFDGSDVVLFSLTPMSPSLATISGASPVGAAADVFRAGPMQMPTAFLAAGDLGLGDMHDNIDGLSFCYCSDPYVCAGLHGIRLPHPGDMNCDGVVNNQDIDHFVMALFDAAAYIASHDGSPYMPCDIHNGDFTDDGLVNNQDIDGFVAALFGH